VLTVEMGIKTNNESSDSVRFGQPDGSVRFGFGFGCQNLWVRSVRLEMALECFFVYSRIIPQTITIPLFIISGPLCWNWYSSANKRYFCAHI